MPRTSVNVGNVVLLPACLRTRVWARRKAVVMPAGRSKRAVKAPLDDGFTVATTVPAAIVEQDAEARMTTGRGGLSSGRVTVPPNVMLRPWLLTVVVYIRRANFSARLRLAPSFAR